jgi:hypothetical protein
MSPICYTFHKNKILKFHPSEGFKDEFGDFCIIHEDAGNISIRVNKLGEFYTSKETLLFDEMARQKHEIVRLKMEIEKAKYTISLIETRCLVGIPC